MGIAMKYLKSEQQIFYIETTWFKNIAFLEYNPDVRENAFQKLESLGMLKQKNRTADFKEKYS